MDGLCHARCVRNKIRSIEQVIQEKSEKQFEGKRSELEKWGRKVKAIKEAVETGGGEGARCREEGAWKKPWVCRV